eukprot:jgi/Botrbrau1/15225/Bobra.0149s0080.1
MSRIVMRSPVHIRGCCGSVVGMPIPHQWVHTNGLYGSINVQSRAHQWLWECVVQLSAHQWMSLECQCAVQCTSVVVVGVCCAVRVHISGCCGSVVCGTVGISGCSGSVLCSQWHMPIVPSCGLFARASHLCHRISKGLRAVRLYMLLVCQKSVQ